MIEGTPLTGREVNIVGAGLGGLATAAYLADAGADVTIYEKNDQIGGVASQIHADGFEFDAGPSWYLMPDVFERFFGHFDRSPEDYYELERLDPHYRMFFKNGDGRGGTGDADGPEYIDITTDHEQVRSLFESFEDGAGEAFDAYLEEAEYTYEVGMEHFVYEDRPRFRDYVDRDVARHADGISLIGSMQDHVEEYFEHPRLQQIMQYTLVFLGGSPNNTPALYNLMSHVDFNMGVWYPEGGVKGVVDAVAELGRELGVTIETGREVRHIGPTGSTSTIGVGADRHVPDAVVANANPAHIERDLLPDGVRNHRPWYWKSRTYAPSAFMLYLGVEGEVDPLIHHTLVLPEDWDPHFEGIFGDARWPKNPAYYLSVASQTDDAVAPDGHSAVVILVPIAPGLDDDDATRERYRDRILADLADNTGVDLRDRIVVEHSVCVSDFAARYNAPQGTALGLAHTLRQTGPFRPGHRATSVDGLYYVGSYTTPGIGMPMVLISGEHAADAVATDLAGTGRERGLLSF
ncbi:MAG: phytoene desaturase [Halobacteriales archaeon]|jgi:phytoene desaturase